MSECVCVCVGGGVLLSLHKLLIIRRFECFWGWWKWGGWVDAVEDEELVDLVGMEVRDLLSFYK